MAERLIYHVDVNSAFLSWEAVFRLKFLGGTLDLRQVPSAVGGDIRKRHGIILAKSVPAKAYGIKTGETVTEALRKCPDLYLAPPNYGLYERCSKAFIELLKEYTPTVEPFSIDEVFMDMSQTAHLFGKPEAIGDEIRHRIKSELGFSVNIGISSNKLLAKMASDFEKPDRIHTLFPEEIQKKMWPLPVGDLFFVGAATEKKLEKLGIYTIGELARTDVKVLKSHLKSHGERIWAFANGRDISVVEETPSPNKGYGNSTTISFDIQDERTARLVWMALSETVGMRLRKDGVCIGEVSISIKDWNFHRMSHQKVLENLTNITNEIYETAVSLFEEVWDGRPIRQMGIHTGRVSADMGERQISIFDKRDYEKFKGLDKTVDKIRYRWGNDSLQRAVFFSEKRIDHLSGGISREKRTADDSVLDIR